MNPSIRSRMGAVAICLAVVATAYAGIRGDGFSRGRVVRFGSVVVNGIEFDTSTAKITVDGVPATQAGLRLGQVLSVEGTFDDDGLTGTAAAVDFDDNVQGPVSRVDLANAEVVVLGQTVRVDQTTRFGGDISPASLTGIKVGNVLEVSARPTADKALQASRIEKKSAQEAFNVNGEVENLTASQFRIGGLTVDYSAASLTGFGGASLAEGDTVQASGKQLTVKGVLIASEIAMRTQGVPADPGSIVELEGFVSRFVSTAQFDVDGQPVRTTSKTVFEGRPQSELGLNADVEVEGILNAAGEVAADKVEIRVDEKLYAEAFVESVNVSAGTLRVLGATVQTDTQTQFDDNAGSGGGGGGKKFSLAAIGVGDFVEVRGFRRPSDGAFVATRVRRDKADDQVILQGFVERKRARSANILGTTVLTNSRTQFKNVSDKRISSAKFFAALRTGSLIKIKGTQTATSSVLADEMEFQN